MEFEKVATILALLTPLMLGLVALAKDIVARKDKKEAEPPAAEAVVQGMTVSSDYAGELIAELRRERTEDKAEIEALKARLTAQRDLDLDRR